MSRKLLTLLSFWTLTALQAHVMPLHFDNIEVNEWTAQPQWLTYDNGTVNYKKNIAGSAIEFNVTEPGKAMKWSFNLDSNQPFGRYLVVRYQASNLGYSPREYALFGQCQFGSKNLLYPWQLIQDGNPHTVAIDLSKTVLEAPLDFIAVNVQAGNGPAFLTLDEMYVADVINRETVVVQP